MPKKVDQSWMKRASEIDRNDKKNAIRGSDLGKPKNSKDIELKPLSTQFPTTENTTKNTDSDKASLTRDSKVTTHGRGRSGTVSGVAVGRKIGASHLHWLKRNWVLCALIIFALFGAFLAIIMFSLPCDPIFKDVSVTISKSANTTFTYSQVECSLPGKSVSVPGICPPGTSKKEFVSCSKDKCKTSSGETTTDMSKCIRKLLSKDEKCLTESCYRVDILRTCASETKCKEPSSDKVVPQICGQQIVKGCEITLGGAGGVTKEHWYPQVGDACQPIALCTYCIADSDQTKYEYPSSGVCPAGTTKDVELPSENGCGSGKEYMHNLIIVNISTY
jgi:hypothetical protein